MVDSVENNEVRHESEENISLSNPNWHNWLVSANQNSDSYQDIGGLCRDMVQNMMDSAPLQPSETKRDELVRLCEARVNKAVSKILNFQQILFNYGKN